MDICKQCSKRQLTCCQDSDIFITLGDIKRISKYILDTHILSNTDFYEDREAGEAYIKAVKDNPKDIIWNLVTINNGMRRVTKKNEGDCIFLSTTGCLLPLEIRPLVCRIYPFDFNQSGVFISSNCACPLDLVGNDPPAALEIKLEDAIRWHKMLYKELKDELISKI